MAAVFYILLVLAEHHGQVLFGGVPVPGATVTATQAGKQFVALTDQQGLYSFPELADGPFTIQVEMLGFSTLKQEVNAPAAEFELKMLPIEDIHADIAHGAPAEPTPAPAAPSSNTRQPAVQARRQTGFQRTEVNASNTGNSAQAGNDAPATSSAFANLSPEDLNQRAADGFLINGSVNNGAASPFAQLAGFGNNRRGRPLYTGGASVIVDNSALDARAYSLTGQDTAKPSYNRFTGAFNVGGPLRIPHLIKNNAPTFFFGYQHTKSECEYGNRTDADGSRAQRRFFSKPQCFRAAYADHRSTYRIAVCRKHNSGGPDQSGSHRFAQFVPAPQFQ